VVGAGLPGGVVATVLGSSVSLGPVVAFDLGLTPVFCEPEVLGTAVLPVDVAFARLVALAWIVPGTPVGMGVPAPGQPLDGAGTILPG
jgi:hypothetical protein